MNSEKMKKYKDECKLSKRQVDILYMTTGKLRFLKTWNIYTVLIAQSTLITIDLYVIWPFQ
jgi:hypothetical protein